MIKKRVCPEPEATTSRCNRTSKEIANMESNSSSKSTKSFANLSASHHFLKVVNRKHFWTWRCLHETAVAEVFPCTGLRQAEHVQPTCSTLARSWP
eukprot:3021285-Amphidinium_carterae.1